MLAPLMNGIAVVLRISGRRMRSGAASTAPPCSPPSLRPRRNSPHRNRSLPVQAQSAIDQLFVNALIQAGFCRRHTRAFHCRAERETSSLKSKCQPPRPFSHSAARGQEAECGNPGLPIIPLLPPVVSTDNLAVVLVPEVREPPPPPTPPQFTKGGDKEHDTTLENVKEEESPQTRKRKPRKSGLRPPKFMRDGKEYHPGEEAGDNASQIRVRRTPSRRVPYDHGANWVVYEKVTQNPVSKDAKTAENDVRSYLPKVFPEYGWGAVPRMIRRRGDYIAGEEPHEPPEIIRYVYGEGEFTLANEFEPVDTEETNINWPHTAGTDLGGAYRPFGKTSSPKRGWRRIAPRTAEQYHAVECYTKAVNSALCSHQQLFSLYMDLPGCRMTYLDLKTIDRTLAMFMAVPLRDEKALLRYMTILNDTTDSSLHLTRQEWNQAMSVYARAYRTITPHEVSAVIKLWTQSEAAGIPGNIDTFNILLNAASRSDDDLLFRRILEEVSRRKLKWNRFTHVTLITHYGSLQHPEGVSAAYQALVDAGEIVDVVVLNAVISAMIACGELKAAQRVYNMMRKLTEHDPPSVFTRPFNPFLAWLATKRFPRQYELERDQQQKLKKMGGRGADDDKESFKKYSELTKAHLKPDGITYNIFISYFCGLGRWADMRKVVAQMNYDGIPANEATYEALLRGFHWFGQPHYTNTMAAKATPPLPSSAAPESPASPKPAGKPQAPLQPEGLGGELENWNRINLDLLLEELFSRRDGSVHWRCSLVRKVVLAVSRLFKDKATLGYYWDVANERMEEQGECADEALLRLYKDVRREVGRNGKGWGEVERHGGREETEKEGKEGGKEEPKKWRVDDERERLREMFGLL